ncbi:putative immunoglobulin-blocking virulence protein [Mycoplasma bradburyae]|uniref:Immunoglobulin-blocking virulence protein n=1 Tax=Mycoplasma bradburyae TaxID=2963128 RepID=A0ABT5GAB1_9MOLU|nr:putative immunoglobulin-blocking virulence protein [Mycoplasma bradburyae]MDC4181813.1 putative immunoglobulin-blocking virulence protein [Mycoplasma bradburyae]UTS70112.1 putative immunoglobulin-blocking virulence protein [Mycoplasma bradburyae]
MLSSKKRKIIKLVSLSASSLVIAATGTIGIVYSQKISNSDGNLIKRQNKVALDGGGQAQDLYNSNRDNNLPTKAKPVDNRPVAPTPEKPKPKPEPKPEPQPEPQPLPQPEDPLLIIPDDTPIPDDPNDNFAATTDIKYVTYDKIDYKLDPDTPKQINDPSKVIELSEADAKKVYESSKALVSGALSALRAKDKEAFRNAIKFNDKEKFDKWWDRLMQPPVNEWRLSGYDDLLTSLSGISDEFIRSEAKANRVPMISVWYNNTTVTFGYPSPADNPYIKYQLDVRKHRVLGSDTYFGTGSPADILSGNFEGWSKYDTTNEFIKDNKYGITRDDGIKVRHYIPKNKESDYYKNKKEYNVFVLDVDNTSGYQKFIDFVNKAATTTPEIGVVLENVGKSNTNRNVYDIIKALPSNLTSLTVFFENANTTSLLALEDRNLRELNIYTTGQVNTSLWAINPLAIRKTNFIPSLLDYNVGGYPAGSKVASTPIIEGLKFDRNDDHKRVQEGLDIAKARRSERIFQGKFQGEGAKPVAWDFSDAPIIRTLENLDVHDAELREIKLSPLLLDSDDKGNTYVTYNLSEFNHSQFDRALRYVSASPDRYVYFGRGTELSPPKALVLKGNATQLEEGSTIDLTNFIKYGMNANSFKQVYTSSNTIARKIRQASSSWRRAPQVIVVSEEKLAKFQPKIFHKDPNLNPIGEPIKKQ